MKKFIITLENPNGSYVDLTAEEEAQRKADETAYDEYKAKEENQKDLKVSAKAKLVAGEALTQEEADTIVL